MTRPKLAHIIWKDAGYNSSSGETPIKDVGLMRLEEVGFIVSEDDEQITLSLEFRPDMETVRNYLSIPKTGIKDRLDFAVPKARKAIKQKGVSSESPADPS